MNELINKYSDILHLNPLFKGILPEDFPSVLDRLNSYTKNYKKNEYIRHVGDPADFIGIVLSGEIHIYQDDYYGKRSITASIKEGALFGEAFSCAGIGVLPVDIYASENSTILFLNSNILFSSCDKSCKFYHILTKNLLGIIARKNIYLNQKLKYHSHKTTREKILAYLNDQAKENGSSEFTIPFNRQQLADYLGVERSAMSLEISKLVKQGIIKTQRSHFGLIKEGE